MYQETAEYLTDIEKAHKKDKRPDKVFCDLNGNLCFLHQIDSMTQTDDNLAAQESKQIAKDSIDRCQKKQASNSYYKTDYGKDKSDYRFSEPIDDAS
mgnify:CR=1 FL=1